MIEVNNLVKFKFKKEVFSKVAKKVLFGENRAKETISLAFVSKAEMKKLNKKFRNKDYPTDVLSFAIRDEIKEKNFLGEIVICPEVVGENAKKNGVLKNYEMLKVFIHGILHLCGYDHERSRKEEIIMDKKQTKYLSRV